MSHNKYATKTEECMTSLDSCDTCTCRSRAVPTGRYWILLGILLSALPAVSPGAECRPTNSVPPGPNFRPVDRHAVDVSTGLVITGQILEANSCRPIAQAKITHWQPSARGDYDDALRAYLYSDGEGRYAFSTEWPSSLVPHIYFMVEADGYQTVTTQWVGDLPVERTEFDIVLSPER